MRRTSLVIFAFPFALAACSTELAHEASYDPDSPLEKQAKSTLTGSIQLEGETDFSQVTVELQNDARTYSVDTAADGSVKLTGIVPGSYRLSVRTRYFEPVTQDVAIDLAEQRAMGPLMLKALRSDVFGSALVERLEQEEKITGGGVSLTLRKTGSIRSAASASPRGLRAMAQPQTVEFQAVSGAAGDYRFSGVPVGAYEVVAAATSVDSNPYVGRDSFIAVDSLGHAHISYQDELNGDLKYATNSSGYWVATTVDSIGWVGEASALALDASNNVHIAYYDRTYMRILYANNVGGVWTKQVVDNRAGDPSLVVDFLGKAHIAYTNENGLQYATNAHGQWDRFTIHAGGGGAANLQLRLTRPGGYTSRTVTMLRPSAPTSSTPPISTAGSIRSWLHGDSRGKSWSFSGWRSSAAALGEPTTPTAETPVSSLPASRRSRYRRSRGDDFLHQSSNRRYKHTCKHTLAVLV